jgi:hypothetical protein
MPGQKPMAKRMQEMLEYIWGRDHTRSDLLDKKVLKQLIKKGKVKIVNSGGGGYNFNRGTRNMVIAIEAASDKEESETGGPYAKRREALEESGLAYRGKNFGKIRLDLPRDAREKKITEKTAMWKKLKDWRKQ